LAGAVRLPESRLGERVVVPVVILHALAQHLDRLQILVHDRLAALLTDTARHEIEVVALRQGGARRLRKLALFFTFPHISWTLSLGCYHKYARCSRTYTPVYHIGRHSRRLGSVRRGTRGRQSGAGLPTTGTGDQRSRRRAHSHAQTLPTCSPYRCGV